MLLIDLNEYYIKLNQSKSNNKNQWKTVQTIQDMYEKVQNQDEKQKRVKNEQYKWSKEKPLHGNFSTTGRNISFKGNVELVETWNAQRRNRKNDSSGSKPTSTKKSS